MLFRIIIVHLSTETFTEGNTLLRKIQARDNYLSQVNSHYSVLPNLNRSATFLDDAWYLLEFLDTDSCFIRVHLDGSLDYTF